MPNRIIKESICTSDTLAQLSAEEERLFYRLLVQADDFGRFDGRPAIILAACFPLRVYEITPEDVESWLQALADADLIRFYEADGRRYLYFTTWDKHQQKRAKYSKYPDPPSNDPHLQSEDDHVIANDIKCESADSKCPRESRNEKRETRIEKREANDDARDEQPDDDSTANDFERALDELVLLYQEYSPVTGKQAVAANVRRRKELAAALKAGCPRHIIEDVIRENAAADMPPWDVRKEACRRAGIGHTRASPTLEAGNESSGLAAALRSARRRLAEAAEEEIA